MENGAQNIILAHVCMILLGKGDEAVKQQYNTVPTIYLCIATSSTVQKRDLSPIRRKVPVTLISHDEQYQNEAYRLVVNQHRCSAQVYWRL